MKAPGNGDVPGMLWAIGALTHVRGGAPAELLGGSLWKDDSGDIDPQLGISNFEKLIEYLRRRHLVAAQEEHHAR